MALRKKTKVLNLNQLKPKRVGMQERHLSSDLYVRLEMMDIGNSGLGTSDKNVKTKQHKTNFLFDA